MLISAVPTVVNTVTLATDPQAHTLVLAAERSVGGTLEFQAFLRVLIGVVTAVILAITFPGQRLAEGVVALELIEGASPHSGATVLLVTAIHAVSVSIAAPSQRDAVAALAMELIVVTAWLAFFLVRTISTVMIPITLPPASNATPIGTGKLTFRARSGLTALFVRVVSTVIVVVALPAAWHTAVVFAAELVGLTSPLITFFLGLI